MYHDVDAVTCGDDIMVIDVRAAGVRFLDLLLVNCNTRHFALARRAAIRPGDTVLLRDVGALGKVVLEP